MKNSLIEALESRIAPAAVFTFTDVDGDLVTLKTTKGTNADLAAPGVVTLAASGVGMQLQKLDLSLNAGVFAGTNFTLTAKPGPQGGDGRVNLGFLDASTTGGGTALNLGKITLAGDLGQIEAGTALGGTAVKALSVLSVGTLGLTTQAGGDLDSIFLGPLGTLKVAGDVRGASLLIAGNVGALTIGGSLVGGTAMLSGSIRSTDTIGLAKIGLNIEGGDGANSGLLSASKLTSVTLGGSLIGGSNDGSGQIQTTGDLSLKIAHDVAGGTGVNSGEILCDGGKLVSLTIGGSVVGNSGLGSARIRSLNDIGTVKIGHDLRGGLGDESAKIDVGGALSGLTIGGSIIGDFGKYNTITGGGGILHSGMVFAVGDIGFIKIAGDLSAGRGNSFAGAIHSHATLGGSVTIGGSVIGAVALTGDTGVGAVKIGRNLDGDILSHGALGNVSVGGSVPRANKILSDGAIGIIKIRGNAGVGFEVLSAGTLGGVSVGGSITSSQSEVSSITSAGEIGFIKVGGDALLGVETTVGGLGSLTVGGTLEGGVALAGALGSTRLGKLAPASTLSVRGVSGTFQVTGDMSGTLVNLSPSGKLTSVSVGGELFGSINAASSKVTIGGSAHGGVGPVIGGSAKIGGDLLGGLGGTDIASVTIRGSLVYTDTLGGFFLNGTITATGRIGSLKIGGDVQGPSLVPGQNSFQLFLIEAGSIANLAIGGSVLTGTDESAAGSLAQPLIYSHHEIGSLTIKGDVRGTVGSGGDVTSATIIAANEVAGMNTNLALGKLTIGGTVSHASVLAGVASLGGTMFGTNGNASIGTVKIGGDWIASSLAAGVFDTNGDGFGNPDDAIVNLPPGAPADAIIARIANISIGGSVAGTAGSGDHFGFVAEQIGKFKAGGVKSLLTAGTDAPIEFAPLTADVTLREV